MRKPIKLLVTLFVVSLFAQVSLRADDLADLAGKWTMNRKLDDGQNVTQKLFFKEGKFTFRMMTEGGSTMFYAEGTAKVVTAGGIKVLTLTDIKAGQSDTDLNSVEETYSAPVRVSGSTCYLATGLDRERNESPRMDMYRKE